MNLFITGATGFLGGKLTKTFAEKGHQIYILARDQKKADDVINKIDIPYQKNIHVLFGDITKQNLGITSEKINELKNKIDLVYHLAALVLFDEHLREKLFHINTEGTKNVLNFSKEIQTKRFFHVSTAYTLGSKLEGNETLYDKGAEFHNPYEESKCHAEHAVFDYKNDFDVSIFRPAIIVGDSKTGEANSSFTLYGLIKGMDKFKSIVSSKLGWENKSFFVFANPLSTSNLVPVDYVCEVLIAGSVYSDKNVIYHITNSEPPTNKEVFSYIKKTLEFPNLFLSTEKEEKILSRFLSPFRVYLNRDLKFLDNNTQSLLKKANLKPLFLNNESLRIIIDGYNNQ